MEGRTRIRKLSGYHFKMRLLSKCLVDCYDYPLFARGHPAPQLAEESSKSVSCVRSFSLFASSSMPGKLEDDSWIASTGWGIGFTRPSVPASPEFDYDLAACITMSFAARTDESGSPSGRNSMAIHPPNLFATSVRTILG